MVSPSSRQAVMSKKSTSSLLERTRFTASPNSQTGIPLLVNLSSGSLVRLPASTTRLKLTMFVSSSSLSYLSLEAKSTETHLLLKGPNSKAIVPCCGYALIALHSALHPLKLREKIHPQTLREGVYTLKGDQRIAQRSYS